MEALIRELRSRNHYREELKDKDLSEALNIGTGSPRAVLSALHVLVNALQHNVAEFGNSEAAAQAWLYKLIRESVNYPRMKYDLPKKK